MLAAGQRQADLAAETEAIALGLGQGLQGSGGGGRRQQLIEPAADHAGEGLWEHLLLMGLDLEHQAPAVHFAELIGDGRQGGLQLCGGGEQLALLPLAELGEAQGHQADGTHRQQTNLVIAGAEEALLQTDGGGQHQGQQAEQGHLSHPGEAGGQEHRHPVEAQQRHRLGEEGIEGIGRHDGRGQHGHTPAMDRHSKADRAGS